MKSGLFWSPLTRLCYEQNRAAQKRFRQRQKTRMATSAQQVQELANQMQTLALEKQRLEAQNRVLLHTVKLSSRHIQDTIAEKVSLSLSQIKDSDYLTAASPSLSQTLKYFLLFSKAYSMLVTFLKGGYHGRKHMPSSRRGSFWRPARFTGGALPAGR